MNLPGVITLAITILLGAACAVTGTLRVPGLLVLSVASLFGSFLWRREQRWSREFARVPDGSSMEDVIWVLGRPTIIADSTTAPFDYSLHQENERVARELWYVPFFGHQQYVFGFDRDLRLIDRRCYISA